MTRCEEFRRALGRTHDGQAAPGETEEARAHAAVCPACAADAALLEAVAARLRERAGPADAPVPPGLRDAVVLRLRRGDAVVIELRPFLRRAAAAAAAILLTASAAAAWQAAHRPRIAPASETGVTREEILAQIVLPRKGR